MRFTKYLNPFRGRQRNPRARRPVMWRPELDQFEARTLPAILSLNAFSDLAFTAGVNVANNLTISYSAGGMPRYSFHDTAETITLMGLNGCNPSGSGTNTVWFNAICIDSMVVNLGNFNDHITVSGIRDPLEILGGSGNDEIDVGGLWVDVEGFMGLALNGILSDLTVSGGTGSNTLRLNDANGPAGSYVLNAGFFTKSTLPGVSVNYDSDIQTLRLSAGRHNNTISLWEPTAGRAMTVSAGAGNDLVNVHRVGVGSSATVDTGGGNDTVSVSPTDQNLSFIDGNLTFNAPLGSDTLRIYDELYAANVNYTVTAGSLTRPLGPPQLNFSGFSGVTLHAGSGNNIISVQSTAADTPVTVNCGLGNDTVNVGSNGPPVVGPSTVNSIRGAVMVNGEGGADTLNYNDQSNAAGARIYTITAASVTRTGPPNAVAAVNYDNTVEALNVHGSSSYNVLSTAAGVTTTLSAGPGNDTITVGSGADRLITIQGTLNIQGGGGTDVLVLNDQGFGGASTYALAAGGLTTAGVAPINFTGVRGAALNTGAGNNIVNVQGVAAGVSATVNAGGGDDLIRLSPGIAGALRVNGQGHGAGGDTLDYTLYAADVHVNLATGTATDATNGISGIENVTGGTGHDALVGDHHGNQLDGGLGRDVLIAGGIDWANNFAFPLQPDTLLGGGGEDLLIAGATVYDWFAPEVLPLFRDLWALAVLTFEQRVDLLQPFLTPNEVVFSNFAVNTLTGGADDDWFFTAAGDIADVVSALEIARRVAL